MTQKVETRLLVTVTGRDRTGVTAALARVVADANAGLLDVEQFVLEEQLTLCLLVTSPEGSIAGLREALEAAATGFELDVRFRELPAHRCAITDAPRRFAVTALGDAIGARELGALADGLAARGANIVSIRQLSDEAVTSVEILVQLAAGDDAVGTRRALVASVGELDIDVAVQEEKLTRRTKRLVVMDMDSTLIQIECIDELARMHGVVDQVSSITARAMAGELDFEQSLRARVALLAGLPWERVVSLADRLPVTEGAHEMLAVLRRLGYRTAVISGGFTFAADRLKRELGLDYAFANELEVRDGLLTGAVQGPVVTAARKAELLASIAHEEGISLEQTIAIGDGANDLPMLERAGLGIAFHAKPKLKAAADTSISRGGLDRILHLLGLHSRDVRELLATQ
jgi:phosphoserine phosphatase